MDRSDEPSAFAWVMSGTVGAVVAAGLGKFLLDRRRARVALEAEAAAAAAAEEAGAGAATEAEEAESEGHPS